MTDLIRVSEAAKIAGVAPITIRRRIAEGQLAQYRRGTNRRNALVSRGELEKLMVPQLLEDRRSPAMAA